MTAIVLLQLAIPRTVVAFQLRLPAEIDPMTHQLRSFRTPRQRGETKGGTSSSGLDLSPAVPKSQRFVPPGHDHPLGSTQTHGVGIVGGGKRCRTLWRDRSRTQK